MAEAWRDEFERRALVASGAPEWATLRAIEMFSEEWSYSEYTHGSDHWLEVWWNDGDKPVAGSRKWDSMAELLVAMDAVE